MCIVVVYGRSSYTNKFFIYLNIFHHVQDKKVFLSLISHYFGIMVWLKKQLSTAQVM